MCTVTFIPTGNGNFIFTSNRDEAIGRVTISPKLYQVDNTKIWMPKDTVSGGTWIGVTDNNRLVCLLNGAFEKHVKKQIYRHSRGKVVSDFLVSTDFEIDLLNYDLDNIEPFTLLIVDWENKLQLVELIWDGQEKYITKLPIASKIWSSSTLYTEVMKETRKVWFANFLNKNDATQESVLDFHQNYGVGDKNLDLQINRGVLKTVSVTSIEKYSQNLNLEYLDLLQDKNYKSILENA
jgi:uncharacterized protein with NRDE domain